MKRGILTLLIVIIGIGVYAQPPGRQGGEPRGGGMPPRDGNMGYLTRNSTESLVLEHFPEIPNLSLKQREQVGSTLTKERESIIKQIDKLHKNDAKDPQNLSQKEIEKREKERAKVDKAIKEIERKSNKKIGKVLNDEQYAVFIEKRTEFKFKGGQKRPPMRERRNDNKGSDRPPFSDNQMFDSFND